MPTQAVFHFEEEGRGRPVMLLHGLSASSHIWDGLCRHSGGQLRLLRADLPRSGRSGAYCELQPARLAEHFARALEQRGVRRCVVAGHSFGGVVALEMAARFPERVEGLLVLSAPALGLGRLAPLVFAPGARSLFALTGRLPPSRRLTRAYLRLIVGEPDAVSDEQVEGYLRAMAAEGHPEAMLSAVQALARYSLPLEELRAWPGPRSVLWGDRDRAVPLVNGERLAAQLGVALMTLPGAGHCLPEERPDAVYRALQGVLAAREG